MTIQTSNLGFPRLGRKESGKAIEGYWANKIDAPTLNQQLTDLHKEIYYYKRTII